jgi:hypothetical protein
LFGSQLSLAPFKLYGARTYSFLVNATVFDADQRPTSFSSSLIIYVNPQSLDLLALIAGEQLRVVTYDSKARYIFNASDSYHPDYALNLPATPGVFSNPPSVAFLSYR